jgi:hypothetical protein
VRIVVLPGFSKRFIIMQTDRQVMPIGQIYCALVALYKGGGWGDNDTHAEVVQTVLYT